MIRNALQHAWSNIRTNRNVCLASIGTIAVALSFLGLFLFIYVNLNVFLSSWSREVQLMVYLNDRITESHKKQLETFLQKQDGLESLTFISREEAWAKFQSGFSENSDILAGLDFNPLPDSYSVRFLEGPDRVTQIRELAEAVQNKPGVESVDFGEKWISRFESFLIFLRVFLFALGALLALGVLFIVSNTIKLSVFSRREELELMQLIGAAPQFIKMPYYLEGVFQGFLGALLSIGIIKILHLYLSSQFEGSLEAITQGIQFQFISAPYMALMIGASILVGWVGSLISVNQFLHTIDG